MPKRQASAFSHSRRQKAARKHGLIRFWGKPSKINLLFAQKRQSY
jgi:hypothetical protein